MRKPTLSMFFTIALVLGTAVSASAETLDIPKGVYDVKLSYGNCGDLTLTDKQQYQSDVGCDGGKPEFSTDKISRGGSIIKIGRATLEVTKITDQGFIGIWKYRDEQKSVGTRR